MNKHKKNIVKETLLQNEEELGCQSILDSKNIVKQETPHPFSELEKQLKQFYSKKIKQKKAIKQGRKFLNDMIKILIDCKLKFDKELYPKLRDIYSYLDQEWMNKKWTSINRDKFRELFDIYFARIDLIRDLLGKTRQENLIPNFITWWAYRHSLLLCEKVGKIEGEEVDKSDMLSFYSLSSMISSLYWNEKEIAHCLETINQTAKKILYIYSEVERLRSKTKPQLVLYSASKYTDLNRLNGNKKLKKERLQLPLKENLIIMAFEKLYEFFKVSEETGYNLWLMIGRIKTAEMDFVSEFERKIPLEYLPDKTKKRLSELKIQNQKLEIQATEEQSKTMGRMLIGLGSSNLKDIAIVEKALNLLNNGLNYRETAKKLKIPVSTLHGIIKRVEAHTKSRLVTKGSRKKYANERLIKNGE